MQNQFDPRTTTAGFDPAVSVGVPRAARDAGLRSYMLKVYNYMASGVLLTGIVAMLFATSRHCRPGVHGGGRCRWMIILVAAGDRYRDELRHEPDADVDASGPVLGFATLMGLSMSTDLPGLHRHVDRADLLRGLGGVPGPQPVGLHDQEGSVAASARS